MQSLKLNSAKSLADTDIISRVINGETALYEVIMRRYNQRLYRIGRGFFRNNDQEIEDVMQTVYIKAYEKLSLFENRSAFSTWLIRIFINESLARKRYAGKFSSINDDDNLVEKNFSENNKRMKNPFAITSNNELKGLLEKSIDELPEKYRVVFVMHEIEKLSVRETAESLDLTESNVKVRLNRARNILRDYLSSYYKSDDIFSFNLLRCDVIVNNVLGVIKERTLIN